jgi:hypothetical protein
MVTRDPMGILLATMLGVLAVVALVSLVVVILSLVAAAVMPLLAAVVATVRRWMWRDWHPPTDWVPDPVPLEPQPTRSPPVTMVSGQAGDADVRLVTARPPVHDEEADLTLTAVHARLEPAATLELPPHARSPVLVCVVSGHGTVGSDRRHVGPGELAVLSAGTPVTVAADRSHTDRTAMEVLVAQVPIRTREPAPEPAPAPGTWPAPLRPLGAAVAAFTTLLRPPRSLAAGTRRRPAA